MPLNVVSHYPSGDTLRSRSVGGTVLHGTLDLPTPPARLQADWEWEIAQHLALAPGDVEQLPLARARTRWPDYRRCVQAATDWTAALGLDGMLAAAEVALMACRGARYHHDGVQYGGAAFCNLFLGEDRGLDLHFPAIGLRIPLARGTAVVFDTGQPHAVIDRRHGVGVFDAADFPPGRDCSLVFLTWELPMENADLAASLGVAFDIDPSAASRPGQEDGHVRVDGERADVCPRTGRWRLDAAPTR